MQEGRVAQASTHWAPPFCAPMGKMNILTGEFNKVKLAGRLGSVRRPSHTPTPSRCTAGSLPTGAPLLRATLRALVWTVHSPTPPPPHTQTHAGVATSHIPLKLCGGSGSLLVEARAPCRGSLQKHSGPLKTNNKKWVFHLVSYGKNNVGEGGGKFKIPVWVGAHACSYTD